MIIESAARSTAMVEACYQICGGRLIDLTEKGIQTRFVYGLSTTYLVDSRRHIDDTQPKHQFSNVLRTVISIVHIDIRHSRCSPDFTVQRDQYAAEPVSMYLGIIEPTDG